MRIYDFEGKKNISGERIREARLKLRLSQSDLAARVQVEGVTMERDSISRIEIGTRFIPDYEIPVCSRPRRVCPLAPRNRVNPRPPRRGLFFALF